jgi:chemotaxis response regulator CheB
MKEIKMGKKIMIVDDAAFMRMMLKNILVKGGFEVVEEAADGAQGDKGTADCVKTQKQT